MQGSLSYFRYMVLWFLTIIHFFIDTKDRFTTWLDEVVNYRIQNEVVYYGLYNKSEQFYACLYDHRSLWDRMFLALPSFFKPYNTFTIDDIEGNMPNVFDYLDAAVVVYAKDGKLEKRLFTRSNHNSVAHLDLFGYAIAEDEHDNEVDLTVVMNEFGVCHSLTCGDLVRIFAKLLKAKTFNTHKIKAFKCMKITSFEDELLKEEDIVVNNDRSE